MSDLPPDEPTRLLPPDQEVRRKPTRFSERTWSLSVLVVVALTALVLGGLAGALIADAGGADNQMPDRYTNMGREGSFVPPRADRWHQRLPDRRGTGHRHWKSGGPAAPGGGPFSQWAPGRSPTSDE